MKAANPTLGTRHSSPLTSALSGARRLSRVSTLSTTTSDRDESNALNRKPSQWNPPEFSDTARCRQAYERACRELRVVPRQALVRQLGRSVVHLRNSSLTRREVNALAAALVGYENLVILDLSGNPLDDRSVGYICQLLDRNRTIKQLNLSETDMSTRGLQKLVGILPTQHHMMSLKISGNRFRDEAGKSLSKLIDIARGLSDLDLSHNELMEAGGVYVGDALATNENLNSVDLSWNHLRGRGAECVALALMKNTSLTHLNLSWNGFGFEGCCALGKALQHNTTLKDLDLTCNRIHPAALYELFKGLLSNKTVECLRLGRNPIPAGYTSSILAKIRDAKELPLCMLDISGVVVDRMFEVVLEEIQESRRFECLYERSLPIHKRDSDVLGPGPQAGVLNIDPLRILFFIKKNLRVIDLFRQIDVDNSSTISREEIRRALLKENFPVSSSAMDAIMAYLDTDKDGEVDLGELLNAERRFKRGKIQERLDWEAKQRLSIEMGQMQGMPGDLGGVGARFTRTFRPDLTDLKGQSSETLWPPGGVSDNTLKLPSIASKPGNITGSINTTGSLSPPIGRPSSRAVITPITPPSGRQSDNRTLSVGSTI